MAIDSGEHRLDRKKPIILLTQRPNTINDSFECYSRARPVYPSKSLFVYRVEFAEDLVSGLDITPNFRLIQMRRVGK
jgi:hypothetical protein